MCTNKTLEKGVLKTRLSRIEELRREKEKLKKDINTTKTHCEENDLIFDRIESICREISIIKNLIEGDRVKE